jgi:hypothetical protein
VVWVVSAAFLYAKGEVMSRIFQFESVESRCMLSASDGSLPSEDLSLLTTVEASAAVIQSIASPFQERIAAFRTAVAAVVGYADAGGVMTEASSNAIVTLSSSAAALK